jgi:amidase
MSLAAATELWRMNATELAEAIKTRRASSAEVIDAHLRRIEAVNQSINAVRRSTASPSRSRTSGYRGVRGERHATTGGPSLQTGGSGGAAHT